MTKIPKKITKRDFIKTAGLTTAAAASATVAAPYVVRAQGAPTKWRIQTYAGSALGQHVIKPSIDAFNKAANGQMEIELYYADQLVPQGELFRAVQNGTIDAAQSEPGTDVTVIWGNPGMRQKEIRATVAPAPYKADNRRADLGSLPKGGNLTLRGRT